MHQFDVRTATAAVANLTLLYNVACVDGFLRNTEATAVLFHVRFGDATVMSGGAGVGGWRDHQVIQWRGVVFPRVYGCTENRAWQR